MWCSDGGYRYYADEQLLSLILDLRYIVLICCRRLTIPGRTFMTASTSFLVLSGEKEKRIEE